ncbi:antichymotrypsin-2-like [Babylonia areolata]|uniref:antichymotrypsin-2-like n=1 Tax=Babylonia areolata TaxID=304850 RepID=UPI003FD3AB1F
MARGRVSTAAVVLLLSVVAAWSFALVSGGPMLQTDDSEPRTVPLYIHKARLYLRRQQAYERTMQGRMETLSRAMDSFTTRLYLQHVQHNEAGNVLLSPFTAYVSLAMALTASQGSTKREVLAAMGLSGNRGHGIHTSVQRAVKSLVDDDTAVNTDLSTDADLSGLQNDEPPVELTYEDLERIMRNDYLMDSSISYNTGQSHVRYSTAVRTGTDLNDSPLTPDRPESELFVRLASGMFHSEEVALSQQFSNRLVSLYGAPPMAMQQDQPGTSVNLWVDAVTRGVVPDMLASDSVSNDTLLVLVNALSFWGSWETNFDEKEMVPLDFQTQGGDSVQALSMYRTGNYSVKNVPHLRAKVLELPYSNTRYSLFIFLPRPPTSVHEVERGLRAHSLHSVLQDMPAPAMTIVLLPKFHLRSRASLSSELKREGVNRLFNERKADLRRMTGEDKNTLFVNDFFQYVSFEVNEGVDSDAGKNSITIGSEWPGTSGTNVLDNVSNTSNHIHIGDDTDNDPTNDNVDDEFKNENDNEDEYEDYEYEDYDYDGSEEEGEFQEDSGNYFIADRPFFFVVKDKQHDLILLMGRVTNPLP